MIVPLRNHGSDAVVSEPLADSGVAISLVSGELIGSGARPSQGLRDGDQIHHRLDSCGVVNLPGGHFDRIKIVWRGRSIVLRDLRDADEFVRLVSAHKPVVER